MPSYCVGFSWCCQIYSCTQCSQVGSSCLYRISILHAISCMPFVISQTHRPVYIVIYHSTAGYHVGCCLTSSLNISCNATSLFASYSSIVGSCSIITTVSCRKEKHSPTSQHVGFFVYLKTKHGAEGIHVGSCQLLSD